MYIYLSKIYKQRLITYRLHFDHKKNDFTRLMLR